MPNITTNHAITYTNSATPWGTSHGSLYREAPPERGTFFRLQVYERAGISLVKIYGKVGKSVIWVRERVQKG